MMKFASNEKGQKVNIEESILGEKYYCNCCNTEVIPKKGDKNAWHFCHKSKIECDKWYDMTDWHVEWQSHFPEAYREITVTEDNKKHRADIKIRDLVVEFQNSKMTVNEFMKRSNFYSKNNHLVWLFKAYDKKLTQKEKVKDYENLYLYEWKHSYSFGNVDVKSCNFDIFIQTDDNTILHIVRNSENKFKRFAAITYSKEEFLNLVSQKSRNLLVNKEDEIELLREKIYIPKQLSNYYYFLNKYSSNKIFYYNNLRFRNIESAFHSKRNDERAHEFINLSGGEANALARNRNNTDFITRPDWHLIQDNVMYEAVLARFSQHPDLRNMLIQTGSKLIVNENTYCDNYWGVCTCNRCSSSSWIVGENKYGYILMEVRKKLGGK